MLAPAIVARSSVHGSVRLIGVCENTADAFCQSPADEQAPTCAELHGAVPHFSFQRVGGISAHGARADGPSPHRVPLAPKTMTTKYETMATFDAAFVASRTDELVVKVLTHGKSDDVESFKEKRKQTR